LISSGLTENAWPAPRQHIVNLLKTLTKPLPDEQICECGCGQVFKPRNVRHRYVDAKHRYRRYIDDKRMATALAIESLASGYSVVDQPTAKVLSYSGVKEYFTAWCRELQKMGWEYSTVERKWIPPKAQHN
jgi:hypothetical protein